MLCEKHKQHPFEETDPRNPTIFTMLDFNTRSPPQPFPIFIVFIVLNLIQVGFNKVLASLEFDLKTLVVNNL